MKRSLTLITILATLATMLAITACDRLSPSAPDELDPVSGFDEVLRASDIWERYQGAGTSRYANDEFKDQWADIHLDGIRRNEDGEPAGVDAVAGRILIIRAPGSINTLEFHHRFIEDTKDYKREDQEIVALCNIKGTDLTKTKIEFIHCRKSTMDRPRPR